MSRVSKKFQKEKAKYLKAIYPIPSKLIKRGSDEGKSILLKISVKRKKRKNNAKSLFLRLFPVFLAQRRGFEPPVGFRPTHDFQSCSLNHSDISALKLLVFYNNFRKKASVFTRFSENCYFFVPFCFLGKDKKAKITLFFGYGLGTLTQDGFNQSQDFSVLLS